SDYWKSEDENKLGIEFVLEYRKSEFFWRFIVVEDKAFFPAEDSTEHFFKEHEWGFGVNAQGNILEYKVEHPVWRIYPLEDRFELNVDFGILYGEKWSFLNHQIPFNIMVAEGSPVKLFSVKKIKMK
ncbi:MAG: DUF2071 domain-containing protein, partial [Saprospiraceae bacterium]